MTDDEVLVAFKKELSESFERVLRQGSLSFEDARKLMTGMAAELLDKYGLEIEERWYCHDCKKDQPIEVRDEVVPRNDGSPSRRVLPTIDILRHRTCKVCGGKKLGISIQIEVPA